MSEPTMPAGTTLVFSVFRAEFPSPGVSLMTFRAVNEVQSMIVANSIILDRAKISLALPDRLSKGDTICMTFHFHLRSGGLLAVAYCARMLEDVTAEEAVDGICGQLPNIVDWSFEKLGRALLRSAPPIEGTPIANAPTTDTKQ